MCWPVPHHHCQPLELAKVSRRWKSESAEKAQLSEIRPVPVPMPVCSVRGTTGTSGRSYGLCLVLPSYSEHTRPSLDAVLERAFASRSDWKCLRNGQSKFKLEATEKRVFTAHASIPRFYWYLFSLGATSSVFQYISIFEGVGAHLNTLALLSNWLATWWSSCAVSSHCKMLW